MRYCMSQPKKRTLFEVMRDKMKKKPVSNEELNELKRESQKERLKADIAKAKYQQKNPGGQQKRKGGKIFHDEASNDRVSKAFGNNDESKYKGLL